MKRVWCLYRVSTKQQVSIQDDLPVQQAACRAFIEGKADWEMTNELVEKGVSGWSKRAVDREMLQRLLTAAKTREFDILLLYMLDRIGRREDELPFIMSELKKAQIEVWSVHEGEWRVDNHTDKLVNYIRYWQAEGESVKISARVKEAKRQLSAAGLFQGGTIPYGYQLVDGDTAHWKDKGRQLKILIPDSFEQLIVKKIFHLYTNEHFGYRKIVDSLTAEGFSNRQGRPFCISTIKRILENPIYIGTARYHSLQSGVQPFNEQLQLIPNDQFVRAQQIKKSRQNQSKTNLTSHSPPSQLLLSGRLICGYCQSKLTGHYIYPKSSDKPKRRYQCPQNYGRLAHKHEQTIWSAKKYEQIILEEIRKYMNSLDLYKLYDFMKLYRATHMKEHLQTIEQYKQQLRTYNKEIEILKKEIPRVLVEESQSTSDQLVELLESIQKKKCTTEERLEEAQVVNTQLMSFDDFKTQWISIYEGASIKSKKDLIDTLIQNVIVRKNEVHILMNSF